MANDGTVKIGVEFSTKDIQNSFRKLQEEGRRLADSLKRIDDALEINPRNVDLLTEKYQTLRKAVANAEDQVSVLSEELEKARESGLEESDIESYGALVSALEQAQEEARRSAAALNDVTRELERSGIDAESLADSLDSISRSSRSAEGSIDRVGDSLDEAADAADRNTESLEDMSDSLDNARENAEDFSDNLEDLNENADEGAGGMKSFFDSIAGGVMVGQLAAQGIGFLIGKAAELIDWIWNLDEATEEYREAMGKLNTAFEAAGFDTETAKKAYEEFYKILGDTDTATEASQLLASLASNEEDMAKWTKIAAGVYGTFGDALPIEGLIEAANETAKTGKVTGVLADAINWAGMSEDELNDSLALLSDEGKRAQLIMNNLGLAYDEASEAFYENNESLIEARENQAKMDEVQAKLGESVQNLKNKFFELFGPALIDLIDAAASGLDGIVKFVDGIGQALDWLKEKIRSVIDFFQELFGASKQASNISVSGDSPSPRTGPVPRRGPSAPMALSDGGEGDGISPYGLSSPRAVSALEGAVPSARDRMISDLAAAMPAAQSRVAIATADMAPSAAYSSPPPASYGASGNDSGRQTPIIVRPNIHIHFDGDLAQFAQVFKPVIDAEDARVGVGVQ